MKFLLLLALLLCPAYATNYYATQSGAGSKNGTSLGNAWDMSTASTGINNASNWSGTPGTSGKISGDDTLTLSGVLTGSLTTRASGTAGHVITINFDSTGKFSASPYSGNAFVVSGTHYITIDGVDNTITRFESLANGTGLANQVNCAAIYVVNSHDVTVQNFKGGPMYVRTAGTEHNDYGVGILFDSSTVNCNNSIAANCVFDNASLGIGANYGDGASNIIFTNNDVTYSNWSYNIGDRGGAGNSLTGAVITGNSCSQWANWNDTSTNNYHHNGVFLYANAGTMTSPVIANNFFGDGMGGTYQTAQIYINAGILNPQIYNNIFAPGIGESASSGVVNVGGLYYQTTVSVYNNTFVMPAGGTGGQCLRIDDTQYHTGCTFNVRNNVFQGPWFSNINWLPGTSTGPLNSNHNIFYNSTQFQFNDGSSFNLATWQGLGAGFDPDAVTTNPNLDGTYHLGSGSSAIGSGANLTSLGFTLLNSDKAGSARPGGATAWDGGVYNFAGAAAGGSILTGKITITGNATIK